MVTAVLFISFVVLLLISVPIGIALGLASLATILLLDRSQPYSLCPIKTLPGGRPSGCTPQ